MRSICLSVLLLAGLCLAYSPQAHADGHGIYGPSGYGSGFYGYRSLYGLGRLPVPPYYALHPPVYYSQPVARTYGTSPFACPCDDYAVTGSGKGGMIENPYFQPAPAEKASTNQTARVIHNPFFATASERLVISQE